jgi:hypothetical protein
MKFGRPQVSTFYPKWRYISMYVSINAHLTYRIDGEQKQGVVEKKIKAERKILRQQLGPGARQAINAAILCRLALFSMHQVVDLSSYHLCVSSIIHASSLVQKSVAVPCSKSSVYWRSIVVGG